MTSPSNFSTAQNMPADKCESSSISPQTKRINTIAPPNRSLLRLIRIEIPFCEVGFWSWAVRLWTLDFGLYLWLREKDSNLQFCVQSAACCLVTPSHREFQI